MRAANCHLALGKHEDAIRYFNKRLRSGVDVCLDRRSMIEATDGLQKSEKVAKCRNHFAELLQVKTSEAASNALTIIMEALSISSYSEKLLKMKGEALWMMQKYEEVVQLCEQILGFAEKNFGTIYPAIQLSNIDGTICNNSDARVWRWRQMSQFYFLMGKHEASLDLIKKQELDAQEISKSEVEEMNQEKQQTEELLNECPMLKSWHGSMQILLLFHCFYGVIVALSVTKAAGKKIVPGDIAVLYDNEFESVTIMAKKTSIGKIPYLLETSDACVKGALHWRTDEKLQVVSFDLHNEVLGWISIPSREYVDIKTCTFVKFRDCAAMIWYSRDNASVSLWKMDDGLIGGTISWTKMFTFDALLSKFLLHWCLGLEKIVASDWAGLLLYNLENKERKYPGISDMVVKAFEYTEIFIRAGYKEKIWDLAAGVVITQEARGIISNSGVCGAIVLSKLLKQNEFSLGCDTTPLVFDPGGFETQLYMLFLNNEAHIKIRPQDWISGRKP